MGAASLAAVLAVVVATPAYASCPLGNDANAGINQLNCQWSQGTFNVVPDISAQQRQTSAYIQQLQLDQMNRNLEQLNETLQRRGQ